MAKNIIGVVFRAQSPIQDTLAKSPQEIISQTKITLEERRDRCKNLPQPDGNRSLKTFSAQQAASPPKADPTTNLDSHANTPETAIEFPLRHKEEPLNSSLESQDQRDDGVSDEVWYQLQTDIRASEAKAEANKEIMRKQEEALINAKLLEEKLKAEMQAIAQAEAKARDEELQELKRKREEARLNEEAARRAREQAKAEMDRARAIQKREQQAQAKLQQLGVCFMGFRWIKQAGGYRCAGGSHYVSDGELGL